MPSLVVDPGNWLVSFNKILTEILINYAGWLGLWCQLRCQRCLPKLASSWRAAAKAVKVFGSRLGHGRVNRAADWVDNTVGSKAD